MDGFINCFFLFLLLQFVLEQLLSILQQASKIEETLLEEELPEWERRNQLACIGCPADTSLELLQKW